MLSKPPVSRKNLSRLLDEELPAEERERVLQAISQCDELQEEIDTYKAIGAALRDSFARLPLPEPEIWELIRHQLSRNPVASAPDEAGPGSHLWPQVNLEPQRSTPMNVSRYMTQKLISATEDMSVKQAFLLMQSHRVRHIPVVDGATLVGIISDRDLRRPRWTEKLDDWTSYYQINDDHRVEHVMTRNPMTVRASDHILEAVKVFREYRFGALPVLNKHGDLVGIISAQDLLEPLEETLTTGAR
jgi:acetoin utilization protein AcuB